MSFVQSPRILLRPKIQKNLKFTVTETYKIKIPKVSNSHIFVKTGVKNK